MSKAQYVIKITPLDSLKINIMAYKGQQEQRNNQVKRNNQELMSELLADWKRLSTFFLCSPLTRNWPKSRGQNTPHSRKASENKEPPPPVAFLIQI